jgi:hypothetical protein
MVDQLPPESPLAPDATAELPGMHTPQGQLALMRAWVRQQHDADATWSEVIAIKTMTLLLAGSTPFELQACQSDVRRVLEVLQAFAWRLAYVDAQVNGLPEA